MCVSPIHTVRGFSMPGVPCRSTIGSMLKLLDRPLWRDWVVWLWALGLVAALSSIVGDYTGSTASGFTVTAVLVDVVLAVVVQTFLFAWLPAKIRQAFRARRQSPRI